MRARAFVTTPIKAVKFDKAYPTIFQWRKYGVEMKNGKSITSYCLQIPELITIVRQWDEIVRAKFPSGNALWFAGLSSDGMQLTGKTKAGKSRRDAIAKGLKKLCKEYNLPFLDPREIFKGVKLEEFYVDGLHPNSKGYDLMFKEIYKKIVKLKYL